MLNEKSKKGGELTHIKNRINQQLDEDHQKILLSRKEKLSRSVQRPAKIVGLLRTKTQYNSDESISNVMAPGTPLVVDFKGTPS